MRTLTLYLVLASLLQAQPVPGVIAPKGWFDLKGTAAQSWIFGASFSGPNLVVGVTGGNRTEIVVLNSEDFEEIARWRLPKLPQLLGAASSRIFAGYPANGNGYRVCAFELDGASHGDCLSLDGQPEAFVSIARKPVAVASDRLWELDFTQKTANSRPLSILISEGPLLAAVVGENLVRADAVSLQAAILDTRTGSESPLTLNSPGLASNRLSRGSHEALASHVIAGRRDEIWLVRGRYNSFTGLLVDKISTQGKYLGTVTPQVPRFPELKRSPAAGSLIGNPTGHMGTRLIAGAAGRFVLIDPVVRRCAWFDDSGF